MPLLNSGTRSLNTMNVHHVSTVKPTIRSLPRTNLANNLRICTKNRAMTEAIALRTVSTFL